MKMAGQSLMALFWCVCFSSSLFAQTSNTDIQVAARAVKFMESPPNGDAKAYIVVDSANPASVADADAIEAAIGKGLKAGSATLTPQRVSVGDLGGIGGGGVVFVTQGLGGQHGAISSALSGKSLLSVSTDLACVQSKHCVIGVASKPKVRILVSGDAASANGVGFKAAFLLLVEKV